MSKTRFTTIALVLAMATFVHAQTFKVIYNFGSHPGDPTNPDGTVSQTPGGNLISTTSNVQSDMLGTAFEMTVSGRLTVLHRFTGPDGADPQSGMILATDQRFHGTTTRGGKFGYGTVFRITPDGKITTEYDFTGGDDGGVPSVVPIQSVGGHLYGVTTGTFRSGGGGPDIASTVYRISASGKFSVLHSSFSGADIAGNLSGPLVQGSDYGFYGTTYNGGTHYDPDRGGGEGSIFRISSEGYSKLLYDFDGTHGSHPRGPLIQASDGNFYGVTEYGGSNDDVGTAFKMTPAGALTVLHIFTATDDSGYYPWSLVEATDGNFYGTTTAGAAGVGNDGSLFRLTPNGQFTKLHDFVSETSAFTNMVQHTNGMLYGTTSSGGTGGQGTMFSLDLGLPPFVTFLTVYGRVGAKVDILGQGFTDDSVVSFNGVPAENPEIQPTYIKAIVPDGATTGDITVTTTSGTLKSNKTFVIH
jgi:uncharacterized repeat protein (TIGR03803 family)